MKSIIFSISLLLVLFLSSISVSAQENLNQTTLIISWIIGFPAPILAIISLYLLIKASRVYGGKLGSGLFKLILTLILSAIILFILGMVVVLYQRGYEVPEFLYIIIALLGTFAGVLSINGARSIIDSTKV